MRKYNPKTIESKWQKYWQTNKVFEVKENAKYQDKKFYCLDMFPYPSGAGLHVGHPEGYTATDIISRKRRMEGYYVLHPMGWDAFGLPAENYAIKTGVHPEASTKKNIKTFKRQIQSLGLSYDWSREINTSSPEYYKWTQWLFLLFYKNGLAYKKLAPVNWCPSCQTVLANEQVVNDVCDRCQTPVVQKNLSQWFFKITKYADRLLVGLDKLDWPEKIKQMQRHWIGKSVGAEIDFSGTANNKEYKISVFTTRPDTLFGVSYIVLAPEHPLVEELTSESEEKAVAKFIKEVSHKTERERIGADKEKKGVWLGSFVAHPLTGEKIPVWIADYVLMNYGTGAVMGVPAHDERDFLFAKKYNLPVKWVIAPPAGVPADFAKAYTNEGVLANSDIFNGLTSIDARVKITDQLAAKKKGKREVNYHLRDWLVSRQRYWGAPIPVMYCPKHGERPISEDNLPVKLPTDIDFKPTGESPLKSSKKFATVACPTCGQPGTREFDTMDTFVDSSWYFLRYMDPNNKKEFANQEKIKFWSPVDLYVGGAEHAVMHLLYARFFTKVLYDLGLVDFDEPFPKLRNQGLIMGEDGQKMSKSRGNVINPDDVVKEYGADTLRLYEMFMGEFDEAKPWFTKSIVGIRRFLDRVWNLQSKIARPLTPERSDGGRAKKIKPTSDEPFAKLEREVHKTIKKVTNDIENFKFNTAISAMMILTNTMNEHQVLPKNYYEQLVLLLYPFAPHLAEEIWSVLGHKKNITAELWPVFDDALTVDAEAEMAVQINGKVRGRIMVPRGTGEEEVKRRVLAAGEFAAYLGGQQIRKVIFVPNRLINIVV